MKKLITDWAPVAALMLIAGIFRFYELSTWPPGLYHDEAFNGLDALRVIAGDRSLYFAANHGREPLFIYLVALSVNWLGRSVYAVRLPAAVIGTLLIPAAYWMARQLFDRRVGWLTAALATLTLWPLHLSLIGLRAGLLPLFLALAIGWGVKAYRSGRAGHWVIAGLLYGLSFYTYLASRFTPLALLLIFSAVLIVRRRAAPRSRAAMRRGVVIFAITTAIVLLPLAYTTLTEWDVVMGRPGDISILNPAINHGDPFGTLLRNTASAAGMFFWRGDGIPRHNVPYRPVFDPLLVIFLAIGLIRLIAAALGPTLPPPKPLPDFLRPGDDLSYALPPSEMTPLSKLASLFVLIWVGVLLLPTILSEDTPHFLRAVGVLPVILIVPAIGLNSAAQWITARALRYPRLGKVASTALVVGVLIVSAAWTWRDYSRYAVDPETAYAFEAAGVQLAQLVRSEVQAGRQVYVAQRFERDWTSVPFLSGGAYTPIPNEQSPAWNATQPATFVLWPYEDWARAFNGITGSLRLKVMVGPLAKGDLEAQPHTGYLAVQVEPQPPVNPQPEAQFANGLKLLGHSIDALADGQWRLRTLWQLDRPITADETFFVHLRDAQQLVTAQDGDSGAGFYPLRHWRPGDVIVDERLLAAPPQADPTQLFVELGLYDRATNQRSPIVAATPPVIDQALWLGGPSAVGPNAIGP